MVILTKTSDAEIEKIEGTGPTLPCTSLSRGNNNEQTYLCILFRDFIYTYNQYPLPPNQMFIFLLTKLIPFYI